MRPLLTIIAVWVIVGITLIPLSDDDGGEQEKNA